MSEGTKVSEFRIQLVQKDGYAFEARMDEEKYAPIAMDEPPPLGVDGAPNPARVLAAAIGDCLSASLVFCLAKKGVKLTHGLVSTVDVEIVRTPEKRLRIGHVSVRITAPPEVDPAALEECLPLFEDFCTVTASVRRGIAVAVAVERG